MIANVFLDMAHDIRYMDKHHDMLEDIGYKFKDLGYYFLSKDAGL